MPDASKSSRGVATAKPILTWFLELEQRLRREQMAHGANLRSVWWISPAQYREGHYAVMPDKLAEICILAGCPRGGLVLDPFAGSGTAGLVADRHGRDALLIELNPEYVEMARRRIRNDAPLFAEVA